MHSFIMRCVFYNVYMLHDTQKPIHGLSMCHAHMFSFDFVVSFKHIAKSIHVEVCGAALLGPDRDL